VKDNRNRPIAYDKDGVRLKHKSTGDILECFEIEDIMWYINVTSKGFNNTREMPFMSGIRERLMRASNDFIFPADVI